MNSMPWMYRTLQEGSTPFPFRELSDLVIILLPNFTCAIWLSECACVLVEAFGASAKPAWTLFYFDLSLVGLVYVGSVGIL